MNCAHARWHKADASSTAGFTLIELLIVIVILGVLAGIAVFGVTQYREDASAACTKANARVDASVSAANAINPSGGYTASGGSC